MHLCGPGLTTISYKKRKEKLTKSKQEELERGWKERNKFLKDLNLPKETFEEYLDFVYGRGKKEKKKEVNESKYSKTSSKAKITNSDDEKSSKFFHSNQAEKKIPSLGLWVTGPVSSKPAPTYTGEKIIGIGTMHKSNMVPIFSDSEAQDISRMRR